MQQELIRHYEGQDQVVEELEQKVEELKQNIQEYKLIPKEGIIFIISF